MGSPTVVQVSNPQEVVVCDSKPDVSIVDKIFHQLSASEKEQAARASSYRYLLSSTSPTEGEGRDEERDRQAKATIQRYVTVEQKLGKSKPPQEWEAAAYTKLQKTLEYRKEKQIDDICLCFDKEKISDGDGLHATIRERLEQRYGNKGVSIVRGYTKDGRAIFQNVPRFETSWEDEEYYIRGNIYMLERALACTERNTNGEKSKVLNFYDYNGYGMKNSPPPMLVKHLLEDLRDHWPERLHQVYIVDAPFVFRAFWAIIKYFIDPITKELVQFVTGEEQKKILREMISEDQAAPYMFDGAKDGEEANMKAFFYDIPFDHVYGEQLS